MPAKNTTIILGDHFRSYVTRKVRSGRYSNTSEVIREGLRRMEEDDEELEALKKRLALGEREIKQGKHSTYSLKSIVKEIDKKKAGLKES
ncbi:MAG: type II toxin-antitoxin system ParD family antitoxin [Gammaproteobacteria bacterium]|nr:type II toxin-antitoxin system ParD family antitoxin [Gammaproteobacteria bacterium]